LHLPSEPTLRKFQSLGAIAVVMQGYFCMWFTIKSNQIKSNESHSFFLSKFRFCCSFEPWILNCFVVDVCEFSDTGDYYVLWWSRWYKWYYDSCCWTVGKELCWWFRSSSSTWKFAWCNTYK
jgi:hypothetical protein